MERNGKTRNVNALHSGTEREDTERIMKRNGTERKRPYLDNEELPEALDWTNRILPVRSSFLAWFKKKLNIARGRPGGLGGGAPQAHSWLICKFFLERTGTEYVERPSSVSVWTPFVMERVAIWNGPEGNGNSLSDACPWTPIWGPWGERTATLEH